MKINALDVVKVSSGVVVENGGQKLSYTKPYLTVYGAVHQFTQGSRAASSDGNGTLNKNTSDRALKTNLTRIGTHPLDIGLYLFDYKPEFESSYGYGRQFGVMADEVETVMPDAVVLHADGFKRVDYGMLGIDISVRRVH